MRKRMYTKAVEEMEKRVKMCKDLEKLVEWVGKGVALTYLCRSERCGEELDKVGSVLGEVLEIPLSVESRGKCVVCGEEGRLVAVAKTY